MAITTTALIGWFLYEYQEKTNIQTSCKSGKDGTQYLVITFFTNINIIYS